MHHLALHATRMTLVHLSAPSNIRGKNAALGASQSMGTLTLPHIRPAAQPVIGAGSSLHHSATGGMTTSISQPVLQTSVRVRPPLVPSPAVVNAIRIGKVLTDIDLNKLKADYQACIQLANVDEEFAQLFARAQGSYSKQQTARRQRAAHPDFRPTGTLI